MNLQQLAARAEIDPAGCWIWAKARNAAGYGVVRSDGKTVLAHRAAYAAATGLPPPPMVCHRCDTPACINPEHLFAGCAKTNARDMVSKGRQQQGAGHWRSELCLQDVAEIRSRALIGESQAAVANLFGISQSVVSEIASGNAWRTA